MLEEAIEVMRRLWSRETVRHEGGFYEVENARLFDFRSSELQPALAATA